MQITSKDKATTLLKNLIRTSQNILKNKKMYEDKLLEVGQLEKDSEIGLTLTKDQEETLKSKKGYEVIVKFMEEGIKNNELFEIENEDEFVKLCVECIFLEKKEVKQETKQDENKANKQKEKAAAQKQKRNTKKAEEAKAKEEEEKAKNEAKAQEEKEKEEEKAKEEESELSNVRIPYAWKSAQFFEGGERERKREHGKKTHIPAKEYRGYHTKKGNA